METHDQPPESVQTEDVLTHQSDGTERTESQDEEVHSKTLSENVTDQGETRIPTKESSCAEDALTDVKESECFEAEDSDSQWTDISDGSSDDDESNETKIKISTSSGKSVKKSFSSTPVKDNFKDANSSILSEEEKQNYAFISEQLTILNEESSTTLNTDIHKQQKKLNKKDTPSKHKGTKKKTPRKRDGSKSEIEERKAVRKRLETTPPPTPRKGVNKMVVDGTSTDDVDTSQDALQIDERDIDECLDSKAQRTGLTAVNVKSIIHELVKNADVQQMLRNHMTEQLSNMSESGNLTFEPKMTRAKVKEVIEKGAPIQTWPLSPVKKTASVKKPSILDIDFPDDEEDDEYSPDKDTEAQHESDDDAESMLSSHASDMGSPLPPTPSTPKLTTPFATKTPQTGDTETFRSPMSSVSGVSTRRPSGLGQHFKTSMAALDETSRQGSETQSDTIAKRTRSKLPLTDTSLTAIEEAFVAPDITPDMYDTECDDSEWQEFLRSLVKSDAEPPEDDVNDPEFDFLEEAEKVKETKEDFRFDKPFRVSKKELNQLITETHVLFPENEDEDKTLELEDSTVQDQAEETPKKRRRTSFGSFNRSELEENSLIVSPEERLLIEDQMRKHVQLTAQLYFLSKGSEDFESMTGTCRQLLRELDIFRCVSVAAHTSSYNVCNLQGAMDLVQEDKTWDLGYEYENASSYSIDDNGSSDLESESTKKGRRRPSSFPLLPSQMEVFWNSTVFLYPQLLPIQRLLSLEEVKQSRLIFTPSEDNLIALAYEQFHRLKHHRKLIQKYLLPAKTVKQITNRIKNLKARRTPDNALRYFLEKKRPLQRALVVEAFYIDQVKAPKDHDDCVLPCWAKKQRYREKCAMKETKKKRAPRKRSSSLSLPRTTEGKTPNQRKRRPSKQANKNNDSTADCEVENPLDQEIEMVETHSSGKKKETRSAPVSPTEGADTNRRHVEDTYSFLSTIQSQKTILTSDGVFIPFKDLSQEQTESLIATLSQGAGVSPESCPGSSHSVPLIPVGNQPKVISSLIAVPGKPQELSRSETGGDFRDGPRSVESGEGTTGFTVRDEQGDALVKDVEDDFVPETAGETDGSRNADNSSCGGTSAVESESVVQKNNPALDIESDDVEGMNTSYTASETVEFTTGTQNSATENTNSAEPAKNAIKCKQTNDDKSATSESSSEHNMNQENTKSARDKADESVNDTGLQNGANVRVDDRTKLKETSKSGLPDSVASLHGHVPSSPEQFSPCERNLISQGAVASDNTNTDQGKHKELNSEVTGASETIEPQKDIASDDLPVKDHVCVYPTTPSKGKPQEDTTITKSSETPKVTLTPLEIIAAFCPYYSPSPASTSKPPTAQQSLLERTPPKRQTDAAFRELRPKPVCGLNNTSSSPKPVSPFLSKSASKSPKRVLRGNRAILPKSFVLDKESPTKRAARSLRKRAQMICQRTSPCKLLPQTELHRIQRLQLSPLKAAKVNRSRRKQTKPVRKVFNLPCFKRISEGDDLSETEDSNKRTEENQRAGTGRKRKLSDADKKQEESDEGQSEVEEAGVLSQEDSQNEDEAEDNQSADQNHLDMLMAASTTLGFGQQKKIGGEKVRGKNRKKKEQTLAMLAPDLLETDPKKDEKDTAFAQAYLDRVQETLKGKPDIYEEFLALMYHLGKNEQSAVETYKKLETIFKDFPELLDEFSGFLLPEQAVVCGCFMKNRETIRARTFLRKLEVVYEKQPSHFQRILKVMSQWYQNPQRTAQDLKNSVTPFLRGVPHLLEEFSVFFPDEKPPNSYMTDFETVSLNDSDFEDGASVDSFEEVDISDQMDPYRTKWCTCNCHKDPNDIKHYKRLKHCLNCSIKVMDGKLYFQPSSKRLHPAKVIVYKAVSPTPAPRPVEIDEDQTADKENQICLGKRPMVISPSASHTSPVRAKKIKLKISRKKAGQKRFLTLCEIGGSPVKQEEVPAEESEGVKEATEDVEDTADGDVLAAEADGLEGAITRRDSDALIVNPPVTLQANILETEKFDSSVPVNSQASPTMSTTFPVSTVSSSFTVCTSIETSTSTAESTFLKSANNMSPLPIPSAKSVSGFVKISPEKGPMSPAVTQLSFGAVRSPSAPTVPASIAEAKVAGSRIELGGKTLTIGSGISALSGSSVAKRKEANSSSKSGNQGSKLCSGTVIVPVPTQSQDISSKGLNFPNLVPADAICHNDAITLNSGQQHATLPTTSTTTLTFGSVPTVEHPTEKSGDGSSGTGGAGFGMSLLNFLDGPSMHGDASVTCMSDILAKAMKTADINKSDADISMSVDFMNAFLASNLNQPGSRNASPMKNSNPVGADIPGFQQSPTLITLQEHLMNAGIISKPFNVGQTPTFSTQVAPSTSVRNVHTPAPPQQAIVPVTSILAGGGQRNILLASAPVTNVSSQPIIVSVPSQVTVSNVLLSDSAPLSVTTQAVLNQGIQQTSAKPINLQFVSSASGGIMSYQIFSQSTAAETVSGTPTVVQASVPSTAGLPTVVMGSGIVAGNPNVIGGSGPISGGKLSVGMGTGHPAGKPSVVFITEPSSLGIPTSSLGIPTVSAISDQTVGPIQEVTQSGAVISGISATGTGAVVSRLVVGGESAPDVCSSSHAQDQGPSDDGNEHSVDAAAAVGEDVDMEDETEVEWTKDMDKLCLEMCKKSGPVEETFSHIAEKLKIVTPNEVAARFARLMELLASYVDDGEDE